MGSTSRAQASDTLQKLEEEEDDDGVYFHHHHNVSSSSHPTGSRSLEERNKIGNNDDNQDYENICKKDSEAMVIMAPMVGGSELAFRMMVRQGSGISLCYSPMLRAKEVVKAYNHWKEKEGLHPRSSRNVTANEPDNDGDDDDENDAHCQDKDKVNNAFSTMAHPPQSSSLLSPSLLSTILHEDGVLFLTDTCPEDRPLVVQLCGCCPTTLYQATQAVLERYFNNSNSNCNFNIEEGTLEVEEERNGIDLNLGCPQSCARDDKFGAFLVDEDPDLAIQCVAAMRRAIDDYYDDPPPVPLESNPALGSPTTTATTSMVSLPLSREGTIVSTESILPVKQQQQQRRRRQPLRLSCKMRLLGTIQETIAFAKRLEEAGCDLLAIHCRHRVVKHHGLPDQAAGQALVHALSIPVVLNGTIQTVSDISKTVQATPGVAGVMIGRALLKNPYLYPSKTISSIDPSPAVLAADYLDFAEQFPPPSVLFLQKHLRWIFRATLEPPPSSSSSSLKSSSSLPRTERKKKENAVLKERYSNWRHRIWTFLVRPYLETIDQFRRVVVLYLVLHHGDGDARLGQTKLMTLSSSPTHTTTVPPSLMKILESSSDPPSFHSIRHNASLEEEQQWAEEEEEEGFLLGQNIFG